MGSMSEHRKTRRRSVNEKLSSNPQSGGMVPPTLSTLPSEILTLIFRFLQPRDLFCLFLVSRYIKFIASSASIWQRLTAASEFADSEDYITRYVLLNAPFRIRGLRKSQKAIIEYAEEYPASDRMSESYNCDYPGPQDEKRFVLPSKAKAANGNSQSLHPVGPVKESFNIYGIDALDASVGMVIGTADDCTVRIWDLRDSVRGASFAQTRNSELDAVSASDVKVDRCGRRLWISADNVLQEWDCSTLQKVSQTVVDKSISAVSPDPHAVPQTVFVATQDRLLCVDTRLPMSSSSCLPASGGCQTAAVPGYPVCVLASSFSPRTVSVAGRFPSVLTYDTRKFPAILNSAYSGAHSLCAMHAMPNGRGIVAAGEYNGRGTLEFYGNVFAQSTSWNTPAPSRWVNRYTASRSSLLSLCQPSWTSELVLAGSADGAIRCFDASLDGTYYRELMGTETGGLSSDSIMITRILPISDHRTAAVLVDGKLKVLEIGSPDDDDIIETEDNNSDETPDMIMQRQMDANVRQAVRRELFGMHNLNAVLVSF
ncbi:hypothetical protein POJ06DRAFT_266713 [Lipomyces tetrasporus]|uniref:F-box domain-containing protein n=1 Tax=Lipomyces tetrasporus TaxID=54092 RepID=A0AAD7QVJ3_9ASCO|nr:uncharacterized protein POJ06DRAFT_266713 [Lipomyces tetrasporus]KAJ8102105.1 hypothetical protein POJ06DRAFT_266713 [Lipomyces tetrasporus]